MKYCHIALSSLVLCLLSSCVVPPGYYGNGPSVRTSTVVTSLRVLPHGYRTIHVGGSPFYHHGNNWYKRHHNGYIRCDRPHNYHGSIGRHSSYHKPSYGHSRVSYTPVYIGGTKYYRNGSSLYQRRGDRYYKTSYPRTVNHKYKSKPSQHISQPVKTKKKVVVSAPATAPKVAYKAKPKPSVKQKEVTVKSTSKEKKKVDFKYRYGKFD